MSDEQASDAARIEEIRQRTEAASPGPWRIYAHGITGGVVSGGGGTGEAYDWDAWICGGDRHEGYMAPDDPDTRFIAHSREDLPFLLSRLDALRAELEASRAREAALEAELYEQWASNHSEHCRSLTVEHDGDCYWPLPALLAGRAAREDA